MVDPYYRGAKRAVIDGVPCRVSRIPPNLGFTLHILSAPRSRHGMHVAPDVRTQRDTADYAKALGLSFEAARVRIEAQRAIGSDVPQYSPLRVRSPETDGYYAGGIRISLNGAPCRVNPTYAAIRNRKWHKGWPDNHYDDGFNDYARPVS